MGQQGKYSPEQIDTVSQTLTKATGISRGQSRTHEVVENVVTGALDVFFGMLGIGPESKANAVGQLISAGVPLMGGAKVAGAMKSGAKEAPKKAIKAYHGSPHDFDRFSLEKIGTGEGAQVYGHGLYFAENEDVARNYREALKWKGSDWDAPETIAAKALEGAGNDRYRAADALSQTLAYWERNPSSNPAQLAANERTRQAMQLFRSDQSIGVTPPQGRMYEVEIKADPDELLDWDAPLSQQSEKVKNALASLGFKDPQQSLRRQYEGAIRLAAKTDEDAERAIRIAREMIAGDRPRTGNFAHQHWESLEKYAPGVDHNAIHNIAESQSESGEAIYDALRVPRTSRGNDEAATAALRQAGIPGIKYLDAGSRSAGDGTRNFVIFNDEIIDILKKYGVAGAISSGALGELLTRQQQHPKGRYRVADIEPPAQATSGDRRR